MPRSRWFAVGSAAGTDPEAGARAADASRQTRTVPIEDRPHRALMLLTDSLAGDQQEIVRGAYGVLGRACRWSAAAPAMT